MFTKEETHMFNEELHMFIYGFLEPNRFGMLPNHECEPTIN